MTHRTDRIPLPADIARCEPSDCAPAARKGCARYEAALPKQGAVLADYSIKDVGGWSLGGTIMCPKRILTSSVQAPDRPKQATKPWPVA